MIQIGLELAIRQGLQQRNGSMKGVVGRAWTAPPAAAARMLSPLLATSAPPAVSRPYFIIRAAQLRVDDFHPVQTGTLR